MKPIISTIPLKQLASGDILYLQVYKFTGNQTGKKAYIQANLHGAEISGNAVIHHLIKFLMTLDNSQLIGEILLVPVCNPEGVNMRSHQFSSGRYNSYDGKDWNRIFWDYEKEDIDLEAFAKSQINLTEIEIQNNYRQQILDSFHQQSEKINSPSSVPFYKYYRYQLQSLCLDADYLIDLHSSTNQSLDYFYCFHGREESAKLFLLDYGILMGDGEYDGDAFDEAFLKPWLALERSLKKLGKAIQFDIESWTLELGSGMKMNPESVEKGIRGVKNYLANKGMLKIPEFPLAETASHHINLISRKGMKSYYAPVGGMIQNRVEPGRVVKQNQRIYQILNFNKNRELPKVIDIFAETDGVILDNSTNHSVNQGDFVLGIISKNN
ncbi:MAG: succinylglutamate desuccinylase/aspartoacylase family protein [Okeania sp. SIO2C9]|uniref:succinylglutamate desuccinylase/aspartoacylase family protein n=1 Tax=Okeania sp. SIO2C9 TaxID=2607791 RepID=UPI0013BF1D8D|nr:succinylglutamate desuccinylase/aspartoacylase family protein [Okeania sp. SIO2C9]NEQ76606.1 succinylglutamate desuccinylase/aspartoacylase family protein [Okeania sp. SIO2C9]